MVARNLLNMTSLTVYTLLQIVGTLLVALVVKYLFAKDVGKGPATYEDCVDFWGKDTKQCDPMKK